MHYEKSILWEKSMCLAEATCRQAASIPREERFGMRLQMTRAAISVSCNVAEGWNRESRREKAQFLAIAQGSLAELNTQILICRRLGWMDVGRSQSTIDLIIEIGRMLTALRQRLRKERAEKSATSSI